MAARVPRDYAEADSISRDSESVSAHVGGASVLQIDKGLGKGAAVFMWFGLLGLVFGVLGFTFGLMAMRDTAQIVSIAQDAARAAAKAETATARANVAEINSYQLYTELARLGIPVKTPADMDHAPQPPVQPSEE